MIPASEAAHIGSESSGNRPFSSNFIDSDPGHGCNQETQESMGKMGIEKLLIYFQRERS